jgi:hypothetical protein
MALVSGRRLSSPANSAALGAVISAASVSAHQAWVARPYQAGTPPNRRPSAASPSRIAASSTRAGARDGTGLARAGLLASQPMSAQTRRPWWSPCTPARTASAFTTTRPRPCSPCGSPTDCGPLGAPSSVTVTHTSGPCRVISTVNWPPCPLRVWRIALLASSSATEVTSSRCGRGGSSDAIHRRNSPSCRGSPGNVLRQLAAGANQGWLGGAASLSLPGGPLGP